MPTLYLKNYYSQIIKSWFERKTKKINVAKKSSKRKIATMQMLVHETAQVTRCLILFLAVSTWSLDKILYNTATSSITNSSLLHCSDATFSGTYVHGTIHPKTPCLYHWARNKWKHFVCVNIILMSSVYSRRRKSIELQRQTFYEMI